MLSFELLQLVHNYTSLHLPHLISLWTQ